MWSTQEGDWVKLVDSALMFLSGSSGGAVNLGSFFKTIYNLHSLNKENGTAMVSVLLAFNWQRFFYNFISPFTVTIYF